MILICVGDYGTPTWLDWVRKIEENRAGGIITIWNMLKFKFITSDSGKGYIINKGNLL